jgi:hypothetical protein
MSGLSRFFFTTLCLSTLFAGCLLGGAAQAQDTEGTMMHVDLPHNAAAMRNSFEAARLSSTRITLDRPVYLRSVETPDRLRGDVYALVDHAYADVRAALVRADHWCNILILHVNVQYCKTSGAPGHETLLAGIGRKIDQPLADVYWLDLDYQIPRAEDDTLEVELKALTGPLGTTDYRIMLEVAPYGTTQSVLHFTYAYSYGFLARVAMQAYLVTGGSNKVGFSVIGSHADGSPIHIAGVRGVLERNTMRYYLAIESYLGAQAEPAGTQLAKRVEDWFSATERYPVQLHEIERDAYREMKLRQVLRQENDALPMHGK